MLSTARGSLPNSSIAASNSGSADSLPLPPTRKRLVDPGHEEDQLHEARALDDIPETVDPVVAGTIRHQQLVRSGDVDEAGIAAARRGIDAAVGARRRQHAERRHRDELSGVDVDLRPRLGDHARRGFGIDRREVAGGEVGQGLSPQSGDLAEAIIAILRRPPLSRGSHRVRRHEATDHDTAAVMHIPHHRLADRIAAVRMTARSGTSIHWPSIGTQ